MQKLRFCACLPPRLSLQSLTDKAQFGIQKRYSYKIGNPIGSESSRVAKPGIPLEVLAQVWSNNHGIDPEEIEIYVEKRKHRDLFRKSPVELRVGPKTLQFAETINLDFRFVQIIDVSELRRLS